MINNFSSPPPMRLYKDMLLKNEKTISKLHEKLKDTLDISYKQLCKSIKNLDENCAYSRILYRHLNIMNELGIKVSDLFHEKTPRTKGLAKQLDDIEKDIKSIKEKLFTPVKKKRENTRKRYEELKDTYGKLAWTLLSKIHQEKNGISYRLHSFWGDVLNRPELIKNLDNFEVYFGARRLYAMVPGFPAIHSVLTLPILILDCRIKMLELSKDLIATNKSSAQKVQKHTIKSLKKLIQETKDLKELIAGKLKKAVAHMNNQNYNYITTITRYYFNQIRQNQIRDFQGTSLNALTLSLSNLALGLIPPMLFERDINPNFSEYEDWLQYWGNLKIYGDKQEYKQEIIIDPGFIAQISTFNKITVPEYYQMCFQYYHSSNGDYLENLDKLYRDDDKRLFYNLYI